MGFTFGGIEGEFKGKMPEKSLVFTDKKALLARYFRDFLRFSAWEEFESRWAHQLVPPHVWCLASPQ